MSDLSLIRRSDESQVLSEIIPSPQLPLDQNPAAVYLATLRPTGRRSMLHALNVIAKLLSDEQQHQHTSFTLPWATLRYQHSAAVPAVLTERYRPADDKQARAK